MNLPYDKILVALVCGCQFKATDHDGKMHPSDIEFIQIYQHGIGEVLSVICNFNINEHEKVFVDAYRIESGITNKPNAQNLVKKMVIN